MLENRQTRTFFTGVEVEHTVAYGLDTLFIVGTPSIDEINNEIHRVSSEPYSTLYNNRKPFNLKHLYFGTSQSYKHIDAVTAERFKNLINYYLTQTDYWVTLDFDVADIVRVQEAGFCEHNRFIPMISVKIPDIRLLNYHATLKLDDTMWGHSNPGVWTHHLQSLLSKVVYTDWSAYKGDK